MTTFKSHLTNTGANFFIGNLLDLCDVTWHRVLHQELHFKFSNICPNICLVWCWCAAFTSSARYVTITVESVDRWWAKHGTAGTAYSKSDPLVYSCLQWAEVTGAHQFHSGPGVAHAQQPEEPAGSFTQFGGVPNWVLIDHYFKGHPNSQGLLIQGWHHLLSWWNTNPCLIYSSIFLYHVPSHVPWWRNWMELNGIESKSIRN